MANPADTTLGGRARLVGYEFAEDPVRPGEVLHLRLVWQCLAAFDGSYTVFTHLEGPDGVTYGQGDSLPWEALCRPTSGSRASTSTMPM